MEITISKQNVFNDVGGKFLQELQTTEPMPPKGTLVQCMNEANSRLASLVGRYLEPDYLDSANDDLAAGDNVVYTFQFTSRKAAGKAQPLADLIHSYLVNAILAKVYSSIGQTDLAAKHDNQTTSDVQVISQLVHSKMPPIL